MKKLVRYFLALGLLMGGLFLTGQASQASELTFGAKATIPSNQINNNLTYFDLKMTPGQKQTVEVALNNDTDKEVVIKPLVKTARTNLNGVVEYGNSADKSDKSLLYKMEDVVKPQQEVVTIPAKSTVTLKLDITMPMKSFDGILAGGLTLEDENAIAAAKKQASKKKGMSIQNNYSYVLGIVLAEDKAVIDSDLTLGKVAAGQNNYRNVINATLHNPKAKYLNDFTVKTKITKKGQSKTLYSTSKKSMQVAPNSYFAFPTELNGKALKGGRYTIEVWATARNNEKWHFKKNFTISNKEARDFNKKDVEIKPDYTWIWILIGFLILLLLILIIAYIYHRKNKEQRAENERLRKQLADKKIE